MGLEQSFHDVKHGPPKDTSVNRIERTDARLDERHVTTPRAEVQGPALAP